MTSGATESSASTITVLASTFASMLVTPSNKVVVVYERRKKEHIRTVVALTSLELYNTEINETPTFDFPEDSLDCTGTSFAGARQEQNRERQC